MELSYIIQMEHTIFVYRAGIRIYRIAVKSIILVGPASEFVSGLILEGLFSNGQDFVRQFLYNWSADELRR